MPASSSWTSEPRDGSPTECRSPPTSLPAPPRRMRMRSASWCSTTALSAARSKVSSTSGASSMETACANRASAPRVWNIQCCTGVSGTSPTTAPCSAETSALGACSAARASSARVWCVNRCRGVSEAGPAGGRDQLDAQDRVAAEREVVVVGLHLGHAEHLGPDRGERLLGSRCSAARSPRAAGGPHRLGQRAPVQLAGRAERQPRQRHHERRDQVIGQPADRNARSRPRPAVRRPRAARHSPPGACGRHARRPGPRPPPPRGGGPARPRPRRARCGIRAPSPGRRCGRGRPGRRRRSSAPGRRCGTSRRRRAERVGEEAPRGEPGTPQVAARHARAAEEQLARRRRRAPAAAARRARRPARWRRAGRSAPRSGPSRPRGRRRPDGGLGRAVDVQTPQPGTRARTGRPGPRRQRLAAEQQLAAGRRRRRRRRRGRRVVGVAAVASLARQRSPRGRRGLHDGDRAVAEPRDQALCIAGFLALGEDDAAADHERQPELERGDVERQRGQGQEAVSGAARPGAPPWSRGS